MEEPIKQVLRYVITLVGITAKNLPDDTQKKVMIQFVRDDLGDFTLDEIRIAFRLAVSGKLDINPETFQNMSSLYIGKVMMAYKKYKSPILANFKRLQAEEEQKEKPVTQEQKRALLVEFCHQTLLPFVERAMATGVLQYGIGGPGPIYRTLETDLGLLVLDIESKKIIHESACKLVKEDISRQAPTPDRIKETMALVNLIDRIGFEKAAHDQIVTKCHHLSILNYISQCQEQKIDLVKLITEKIK